MIDGSLAERNQRIIPDGRTFSYVLWDRPAEGRARITITQGVDMGRPSTLMVDVPAPPINGIRVSGTAVPIPP